MSNEQKPSADAMAMARDIRSYRAGTYASDAITDEHTARMIDSTLARVRREARAEAFEEAARRADADLLINLRDEFRALAAKERAS